MNTTIQRIPAMAALAALCLMVGCSSGSEDAAEDAKTKVEQTADKVAGDVKQMTDKAKTAPKDAVAEGQAKMAETPLLNWRSLRETAPDVFKAKFETSKGDFIIEVHRDWSPRGADRFYNLVKNGFYDDCRFFRVLDFMAQVGINGDPKVSSVWQAANIPDDPVRKSNTRGMVSYAKSGAPNSRSTQIFVNYRDNSGWLDAQGFSPFGVVDEAGMEVVDSLYADYGEGAPKGQGPNQAHIQARGNAYLQESFPNLDYVEKASIVE